MLIEALPNLALAWSIQAFGALSPGPSAAFVLGLACAGLQLPSTAT